MEVPHLSVLILAVICYNPCMKDIGILVSTDVDIDGNSGNIVAIGHLSGDFTNE